MLFVKTEFKSEHKNNLTIDIKNNYKYKQNKR